MDLDEFYINQYLMNQQQKEQAAINQEKTDISSKVQNAIRENILQNNKNNINIGHASIQNHQHKFKSGKNQFFKNDTETRDNNTEIQIKEYDTEDSQISEVNF